MARFALIILMLLSTLSPVSAGSVRVISLYPGHSENIYAMGGELIAVSENDEILPGLPRISLRSGAEKILSTKPDVIVTRPFAEKVNPNLYEILRRSGVKVISLDPPSWEKFPDYLRILADGLNLDSQKGIERLNSAIAEIKSQSAKTNRPRVFLEATSRELHTCSPDSWAAKLIELAGGVNIAADAMPIRQGSAVAPYGIERILMNAESLDVYIIQTGAMNSATLKDFHEREWSSALKNVKVVEIPERYISRPSLLGLEEGGRELARIFRDAR